LEEYTELDEEGLDKDQSNLPEHDYDFPVEEFERVASEEETQLLPDL
jgi:hypothetical protein